MAISSKKVGPLIKWLPIAKCHAALFKLGEKTKKGFFKILLFYYLKMSSNFLDLVWFTPSG